MFSAWLGSLHNFCCARLSLWDRIPRVLWDTLADESISPGQMDGGGSWAGSRPSASLSSWNSRAFRRMAAADGKLSKNFSPLENEWDRQDQLSWFSRDDPPPLQQPELLKWRHWRPGKIREWNPRLSEHPLRSTLHTHPGGGLPQGSTGPLGG